ncbi:MAG: SDR family NAD(P)-dependent oxidoreductase [Sandaracinus sp.]
MIRDFRDKVCVVTGAASGIGAALARALDAEGATLVLVDRDPRVVDHARRYRHASGHELDVADAAAWTRLAGEVGAASVLVNNAGISVAGRFDEIPADVFDRLFAVNFGGVVHGCRAFMPLLRAQPEAHVVNVCSSFAWLGFPGKSAYAASKAAVRAFSESLRAELSETGVGVTLLFPGPVDTDLVRKGHAVDPAQREREAAFLAGRAIPAERVAARCLAGIRKNHARVLVGVDYRALDLLVRCSPVGAAAVVTALSKRMPF